MDHEMSGTQDNINEQPKPPTVPGQVSTPKPVRETLRWGNSAEEKRNRDAYEYFRSMGVKEDQLEQFKPKPRPTHPTGTMDTNMSGMQTNTDLLPRPMAVPQEALASTPKTTLNPFFTGETPEERQNREAYDYSRKMGVPESQLEDIKPKPKTVTAMPKPNPQPAPKNALGIYPSPDWSTMSIHNLATVNHEAHLRAGIEAGRATITPEEEAKYKAAVAVAGAARKETDKELLHRHGIKTVEQIKKLQEHLEQEWFNRKTRTTAEIPVPEPETKDFFEKLATYPELMIEMAAHIRPKDLVSLYATSKPFHEVLNGHLTHTMKLAADTQAAESAKIFGYKTFPELLIDDPAGRPDHNGGEGIHQAPSLKWLQLVVHRDKVVRDILASLARQGHRLPKGTRLSLKKMWTLMDLENTEDRLTVIGMKWFSPQDLWNLQCFVIKLDMRFNDPLEGPGSDGLRNLMLGQQGLTPLRNMLTRKRFRNHIEVFELVIRYDYEPPAEFRHVPLWGIGPDEFGIGHLEGWGEGDEHLMRPDELIIHEACRRQLGMKKHIMNMMLWGYIDPITCKNTPPTADEMYMSDDDEDTSDMARFVERMNLEDVVKKNQQIDSVLGLGHHGIVTDIHFDGNYPGATFLRVPGFVEDGCKAIGLGDLS